jgi:hypothetical protein
MSTKTDQLRAGLSDPDEDEVYSTLINIGKGYHTGLKEDVEKFLAHSNIELRSGAIRVLGFYWRLPEYKEKAWEMFIHDPDDWVRAGALMAWIGYHEDSGDKSILKKLHEVLINKQEDESIRKTAYTGIFVVSTLQAPNWPNTFIDDIDAEADWELVKRLVEAR